MTDFRGFKGRAKRIEDIDLVAAGAHLGVNEDKIHAVLDVESAGTGFDGQKRPKMLFEPHIFYRELGPGAKRDRAVREGLAYSQWKAGAYPPESYTRLMKAIAIDETKALRSASWGLGQIMGFNHALAGYATPQEMVLEFMDDEDEHLYGMITFIKKRGLDDELRAGNWAGFAYGYNGASYAKHGYHTKLAAAYRKWQAIPDSHFDAEAIAEAWEKDNTPVYDPAEPAAEPVSEPVSPPTADDPGPESDAPTARPGWFTRFFRWLLGQ